MNKNMKIIIGAASLAVFAGTLILIKRSEGVIYEAGKHKVTKNYAEGKGIDVSILLKGYTPTGVDIHNLDDGTFEREYVNSIPVKVKNIKIFGRAIK